MVRKMKNKNVLESDGVPNEAKMLKVLERLGIEWYAIL